MENSTVLKYLNEIESSMIPSDFQKLLISMAIDKNLQQWLKDILSVQESKELYRDKYRGFVLTAYTEKEGQYRIPHNHGQCWVVYAVMSGTMEMNTFTQATLQNVSSTHMSSGNSQVYRPGEIHDTRCISENAIILRLTSCDLKVEEHEGRMKRFHR